LQNKTKKTLKYYQCNLFVKTNVINCYLSLRDVILKYTRSSLREANNTSKASSLRSHSEQSFMVGIRFLEWRWLYSRREIGERSFLWRFGESAYEL